MHTLLKIAEKEIGQKEIAGAKHNQRIVQYSIDLGFPFRDDETAWCSIFMNWVALQAGFEKSNSGTAQSWLNVGKKVTSPEDGDVVLVSSSGNFNQISHVGLFYGFSEDKKKGLVFGRQSKRFRQYFTLQFGKYCGLSSFDKNSRRRFEGNKNRNPSESAD